MRAVTVVAGSLALVLAMSSGAGANGSTLCPPKGTGSGPWGAPAGDPTRDDSCNGLFDGASNGSLVKTTSAGANGGVVSPGQTITVTLTWDRRDFGWPGPAKSEDCVAIGSRISRLTQEHPRAPLNGNDTFSYVVPADTGGQTLCDRGVVWGYANHGGGWFSPWFRHGAGQAANANPEKSAILCYSVLGAQTPEAPSALMLPAAGLVIGGGAYLVVRRRRRGPRRHHAGGMSLSLGSGRRAAARGSSGR